jgi:hypothetical protein
LVALGVATPRVTTHRSMATMKIKITNQSELIVEHLRKTKPGDLVPYRDLHNLTGINDLPRLRGYIYTAFRILFRQSGIRFGCDRSIGYIRLDETGKNTEVSGTIKRMRRHNKRATRLHQAVAFNALDALGKLTHVTNATQLAEIKKAASRARRNKIANTASENKTVEAVIDGTLELFRRKGA